MSAIKLAIQKTGRLADDTLALLKKCGLTFDSPKGRLIVPCEDFPLDLLMVRDDDIPGYVDSAVSDLGIVGYNVLREIELSPADCQLTVLRRLGFGRCRLAIAVPQTLRWEGVKTLSGLRIATTYPHSLAHFLAENQLQAKIVTMSGAVEIAPGMGMADAICDLVSSGATLRSNGLREVELLYESEAVLIAASQATPSAQTDIQRLRIRIDGVLKAHHSRYIMMNASRHAVEAITAIAPGLSRPTIMPLAGDSERVAIHIVAAENIFWETLEQLKAYGASDILVLPIEKLMV